MNRACELKDHTLKKIRTLHFLEGEGVNLRKSVVFCKNLRFWALSVALGPSP